MTSIERLQVTWSGGLGLPGITTFYATPGGGHQSDIVAFFTALQPATPAAVTFSIPAGGETFNVETGLLEGTWTGGTATNLTGTAAGPYSAGVGAVVNLSTAGIVAGRKVRGRFFLCPQAGGQFQTDGSLTAAAVTFYLSKVQDLKNAMGADWKIWSRPRPAPGGIGPDSPGSAHSVTSFNVPDRPSVLRSRYK